MGTIGKRSLLAILFFVVSTTVSAAEFRPGKDYEELNFPQPVDTGKKIEVREFFWYGCPHCYAFEPVLNHWLKNKPSNVSFVHTPSIANPRWEFQARVYFALEAMNKVKIMHTKMFRAIHVDKKKLNTMESVTTFLTSHGVSKEEFTRAFNSFGVRLKLKRAGQAGLKYEIHGVPTIIVDGKYRTSPSMAGGEERTIKVINFLVRKAARERR